MHDPLTLTIIFIIICTLVAAFIRRTKRDKCLKNFEQTQITLEKTNGKIIWGKLRVESTGLELVYQTRHEDKDGHFETSYILYKFEYPNIQAIVRFHDQLSDRQKKKRLAELKRTYHPGLYQKLKRRVRNIFMTVRDSVVEVVEVLISRVQKSAAVGKTLTSQGKYVSQMKGEVVSSIGTSYEPLLERHIGKTVVLEVAKGEKILEYSGFLKDYTADFIEIMDVDYRPDSNQTPRKADLVVLRKYGVVRHLGQ
ncbi:MAG: hypothetical protein JXB29_09245 [Sedimentisphaerales bacterium]|nr:hypothetical protein [Sedimentisphaerales bacterium]